MNFADDSSFVCLPVALSCQQIWRRNNPFLTHPIARKSILIRIVLCGVAVETQEEESK